MNLSMRRGAAVYSLLVIAEPARACGYSLTAHLNWASTLPASATSLSTAGSSRAARKAQAARRPLLAQWITHLDSELHPAGAMDASPTHRVTSSSNLLFQLVLESDATCLDVEALKIRLMQQAPMGSTAESQLATHCFRLILNTWVRKIFLMSVLNDSNWLQSTWGMKKIVDFSCLFEIAC